jgi:hypothetical protein
MSECEGCKNIHPSSINLCGRPMCWGYHPINRGGKNGKMKCYEKKVLQTVKGKQT